MAESLRKEMIEAFWSFNARVEHKDWPAAVAFFVPDAIGGNVRSGVVHGRAGLSRCFAATPPDSGYESLWQVIDPPRLVHRWRRWLPGRRADGSLFEFEGLTEMVYAGGGLWKSLYTTPDLIGMQRVGEEWRAAQARGLSSRA